MSLRWSSCGGPGSSQTLDTAPLTIRGGISKERCHSRSRENRTARRVHRYTSSNGADWTILRTETFAPNSFLSHWQNGFALRTINCRDEQAPRLHETPTSAHQRIQLALWNVFEDRDATQNPRFHARSSPRPGSSAEGSRSFRTPDEPCHEIRVDRPAPPVSLHAGIDVDNLESCACENELKASETTTDLDGSHSPPDFGRIVGPGYKLPCRVVALNRKGRATGETARAQIDPAAIAQVPSGVGQTSAANHMEPPTSD